MVSLAEYNTSARMRSVMEQVAQSVVERLYPTPRYATVTAFSTTARTVTVRYPDEPATTFTIPCGTLMPSVIGATVRVVGRQGARYVDEIIDGKVTLAGITLDPTSGTHVLQALDGASVATLTLNPSGGTIQLGGGGTPAQQIRMGDDTFFTDINVAHTLGLQSTSDSTRASLKLGSAGPTFHGLSTYYHLQSPGDAYYDANTHYFRSAGAAARMTLDSAGGLTVVGSVIAPQFYQTNWYRCSGDNGLYFETHAGGIYMIDNTWVRAYNGKWFLADRYGFSGTGYKFTHETDTDTGFYYDSDGKFRLIANGQTALWINGATVTIGNAYGATLRLYSETDNNHRLQYQALTASQVHPSSGIGNDGPILVGWSSVALSTGGGASGQVFLFASSGNAFAPTGWTTFSSIRNKENIRALDPADCLKHVKTWKPISYRTKDRKVKSEGFTAEDMFKVTPDIVVTAQHSPAPPDESEDHRAIREAMNAEIEEGAPIAIDYSKLTVRLTGAVQALTATVETLMARIEELENK